MNRTLQKRVSTIIAIDPGPTESAWVLYSPNRDGVLGFGKESNDDVLRRLIGRRIDEAQLVIEMIASFGMAVGAEVFETVYWIGRFSQAWKVEADRIKRHEVKMHVCKHPRATDANIRQAMIDRWGGKDKAIGKKASPGPLYGMSGDCWQALALAVTYAETRIAAADFTEGGE